MATFGKNILENLTTGMYYDSKVIYREYIQNSCDQIDVAVSHGLLKKEEGSVDIAIDTGKRNIVIRDNATGIPASEFRRQLEDIANSDKERGKNKGFRGIGRLCGLAYCKTLTFRATAHGESITSVMKMNAKLMREMIASKEKYTVDDILFQITSFYEETAESESHGFEVCLEGINIENTDLLDAEKVKDYLAFVAPVPYSNKFRLRTKIYEHAQVIGYHIDEYNIYVNGSQIFKDYGMRLYEKTNTSGSKQAFDEFCDLAFHDIYDGKGLVAWMWYGLCRFEKAIPKKENPMYGFRVRQSNIQIGDNTILAKFFKEDRGNSYFVGEVFAVSPELTPNSQRDNFNENPTRIFFEEKIMDICYDELTRLYNMAAKQKGSYKRLGEYAAAVEDFEKKKEKGFVDDKEREDLERRIKEAEARKDEAQKYIFKSSNEGEVISDSPSTIVQKAIKSFFDQKHAEERVAEAETKQGTALEEESEKPKYFTDSLSKLDKSKRKLVAQVLGIVSRHIDEDTLNMIKADLEKEFR